MPHAIGIDAPRRCAGTHDARRDAELRRERRARRQPRRVGHALGPPRHPLHRQQAQRPGGRGSARADPQIAARRSPGPATRCSRRARTAVTVGERRYERSAEAGCCRLPRDFRGDGVRRRSGASIVTGRCGLLSRATRSSRQGSLPPRQREREERQCERADERQRPDHVARGRRRAAERHGREPPRCRRGAWLSRPRRRAAARRSDISMEGHGYAPVLRA